MQTFWEKTKGFFGLKSSARKQYNPVSNGNRRGYHALDDVLLNIPLEDGRWDTWTLRDAVRGVQIFGGIGSGKSSGSGKTLAKTYLKQGYGGVVLTAKMEEAEEWKKYAQDVGREVEIFQHDEKFSFNPLQYEMERDGGGDTLNLTNLIMSIYEMGKSFTGGGSSSGERYWDDQLRLYISRSIALLKMANEPISISNMRNVLTSAPDGELAQEWDDKLNDSDENFEAIETIARQSYCLECLLKSQAKPDKDDDEQDIYDLVDSYFLKEFAKLSEKTRSIVETSFYGMVEPFMGGILKKYFTKGVSSEITPEKCYEEGKVIIINFPIKKYLVSGVYAQAIYKKLWQEAIERRRVEEGDRPVFLWVDEAQYFLGKDDAKFQTTARSSLACTVFITQNISNYYASIGGKYPKETTNSLLAVLGTKIFHSNNDYITNEWASNTIGKTFQLKQSTSSNIERLAGTLSESDVLHYQVQPEKFTTLTSGGKREGSIVEGVITVAGKRWKDGRNHTFVVFDQNFKP